MKAFYLIFIAVLFVSCSSSKIEITNKTTYHVEKQKVDSLDFWTSFLCYMPENILTSEYYSNVSQDKKLLAATLKDIKNNNNSSVKRNLHQLLNSENDTIQFYSKKILNEIYINEENWTKLKELNYVDTLSKEANIQKMFYMGFENNISEIKYSDIPDSIFFDIKKSLIFIPVKINGKNYNFLYDSGFDITVINSSISEECGIDRSNDLKDILVGSTGHSSDAGFAIIDSLEIGKNLIFNKETMIMDDNQLSLKLWFIKFVQIDGVIGYDIIKKFINEINYPQKHIILSKPQPKEMKNELFWLSHPLVKFESMSGNDLYFLLDIGANNSSFLNNLVPKSNIEPDSKKFGFTLGIGGSLFNRANMYKEYTLKWNDKYVNFENLTMDKINGDLFYKDGVVGLDFFKDKTIILNPTYGEFHLKE